MTIRPFTAIKALVFLFSLSGCEAPLRLDGVEQERAKPVLRFDQFQAAAMNQEALVVVGSYGVVLISNDAGKQWRRVELPNKPALFDVAACPDGTLIALDFGRKVWVSNDHGATWAGKDIATKETPQAMTCDQKNRLWVTASFSTILQSPDHGSTWNTTSLDEDLMFTTIQFLDSQQGVLTGEFGTFTFTRDGGETWQRGEPIPDEFYPQAAWFSDRQTGWVVGLKGTIFGTTDGGQTWAKQDTGTDAPLYGITASGSDLFAVGDQGTILRFQGGHWIRQEFNKSFRSYIRAVHVVTQDTLLVAGGFGMVTVISTADHSANRANRQDGKRLLVRN